MEETGAWVPGTTAVPGERTATRRGLKKMRQSQSFRACCAHTNPHCTPASLQLLACFVSSTPWQINTRGLLADGRDLGINVLDTASAYLLSEERIGNAVADRRSEYFLASKCGEYSNYEEQTTGYDFSYGAVSASIDNSLKLLQTDVIDLMQIHFGPDQQKVIDDGEGDKKSNYCLI